ncbi:hypothetical protein SAMD00019534_042200 [Acytostelium subglobosum LB1]|uniref:hypothetical protein n=1 Tax=Acytostelium subglobosum LB1 TaxID=1410327 RepID=UPI000644BFF5|nr:hypothetical protein SAMD00019534_042200 [Acytostelium subglobosum LB1]GAM21045.1 hypothetical protein SAMD00019534_042200 [Acytostelium subglobosum LB1]|eukprot:XP_012756179.1 hypothetical protein SAMD00019534_042200 [Acytostelium subglobosum LB1]
MSNNNNNNNQDDNINHELVNGSCVDGVILNEAIDIDDGDKISLTKESDEWKPATSKTTTSSTNTTNTTHPPRVAYFLERQQRLSQQLPEDDLKKVNWKSMESMDVDTDDRQTPSLKKCSCRQLVQRYPWIKTFIFVISVIQVFYFIASLCLHGFATPSVNPMLGPPSRSLMTLGAKFAPMMVDNLELWRHFTPIILHTGVVHLLCNLLSQVFIGLPAEMKWGTGPMAAIYITSGFGGILFGCIFNYWSISVGASGALFGILGAFTTRLILNSDQLDSAGRKNMLKSLLIILTINIIISLAPWIDWTAHLGGFITGMIVAYSIFHPKESARYISLIALTILLAGGLIFLYLPAFARA